MDMYIKTSQSLSSLVGILEQLKQVRAFWCYMEQPVVQVLSLCTTHLLHLTVTTAEPYLNEKYMLLSEELLFYWKKEMVNLFIQQEKDSVDRSEIVYGLCLMNGRSGQKLDESNLPKLINVIP